MTAPTPPESRCAAAPRLIETELPDELILLDPATQEMFSLNPAGRVAWHALKEGSVADAVHAVSEAFGIPDAQAEADVQALLPDLIGAGLLRLDDAGDA